MVSVAFYLLVFTISTGRATATVPVAACPRPLATYFGGNSSTAGFEVWMFFSAFQQTKRNVVKCSVRVKPPVNVG